jgi:hypothetical protein
VTDSDEPAFYRAFLAMSYLLGNQSPRGAKVPDLARGLVSELASDDRQVRAAVLARELGRVAASLDARRLS